MLYGLKDRAIVLESLEGVPGVTSLPLVSPKLKGLSALYITFALQTSSYFQQSLFLDTHVSLAPTHVCLSVRPLVRTFGFPADQRLWSPYVKS